MSNERAINRRALSIGPMSAARFAAYQRSPLHLPIAFEASGRQQWPGGAAVDCKKSTNLNQQIVRLRYQFTRATSGSTDMEPYQHIYPQQNSYRGLPCTQNIYYPSVTSHFASYASGLDSGHAAAAAAAVAATAGPNFSWGYSAHSAATPTLQAPQTATPGYPMWRHAASHEQPSRALAERVSPATTEAKDSAEWNEGCRSRQGPPGLKEETASSPKSKAKEEGEDSTLQIQGEEDQCCSIK